MNGRRTTAFAALVAGLGAVIGAVAVAGLLIVYLGGINVAAMEEHPSFVRWAFDTTFQNSVERHAEDIAPPDQFTPEMIAAGGGDYKAMCQHCHAGPGVQRAEWASGMRPRPPHLTEAAEHWELAEVFWLAKHGVKMTGMPAFGPTHDDSTLWNIAAFVKKLPGITAQRYAALGEGGSHAEGGETGAEGDHSHAH